MDRSQMPPNSSNPLRLRSPDGVAVIEYEEFGQYRWWRPYFFHGTSMREVFSEAMSSGPRADLRGGAGRV